MSKTKSAPDAAKTGDVVVVNPGSKPPQIYVSGQVPFKGVDHCHIRVYDEVLTLRAAIERGLVIAWQGSLSGNWHWSIAPVGEPKSKAGSTEENTQTVGGEKHVATVIHN